MISYIIHDMYLNRDFTITDNEDYVLGVLTTMLELKVTHKYQCFIKFNKDNQHEVKPEDLYNYIVMKKSIMKWSEQLENSKEK